MTFLAPGFLALGAAVAAAVVVLHFFSRQRPRPAMFPTARFVPDTPARAPSRSRRLTDPLLLMIRVASVLLIAAAFARPVPDAGRRPVARVVLVDRSRAVRSATDARDSALALLGDRDVLVLFDSSARVVREGAADSLRSLAASGARGSISVALVAALRAAPRLAPDADSIELILVSPLAVEEWDASTADLRGLWRGRARLARVAGVEPGAPPGIELRAPPGDPLRATVALMGRARAGGTARLVRDRVTEADSAWARMTGNVLIFWPVDASGTGWRVLTADTLGAVIADGVVAVAPFPRVAEPPAGEVIARWVDGLPAAAERPLGRGCERDVAIPVAAEGDFALKASAQRLLAALAAPCGGVRRTGPLTDSLVAALRGEGALLAGSALPRREPSRVPASAWLLLAALLAVLLESAARTRGDPA